MTTQQTIDRIIDTYVNGWLSHSAARSALKAIGISVGEADRLLRATWYA